MPNPSRSPTDDERTPASVVERRIQEAMDAGEFDDLPGAGRPLEDLDIVYDPAWWARKWVQRERIRDAAEQLEKTIRREVPRLRLRRDPHARERIAQLDAAIDEINRQLPEEDRLDRIAEW